jgi:hypothetical protein
LYLDKDQAHQLEGYFLIHAVLKPKFLAPAMSQPFDEIK